jgi:hypothetical protein
VLIDDYNEMVQLETLLKKVGFDTIGIQNEQQVTEKLVAFRPEIIIVDFQGSKIHGLNLGSKIKKNASGIPRMALLLPKNIGLTEEQLAATTFDAAIERPYGDTLILKMLGHLSQIDIEALLAKYLKLVGVDKKEPFSDGIDKSASAKTFILPHHPSKGVADHSLDLETTKRVERELNYARHLQSLPTPEVDTFPHQLVRTETAELRAIAKGEDLEDLEEERREFVRLLFKKAD